MDAQPVKKRRLTLRMIVDGIVFAGTASIVSTAIERLAPRNERKKRHQRLEHRAGTWALAGLAGSAAVGYTDRKIDHAIDLVNEMAEPPASPEPQPVAPAPTPEQ